jgi:antirestriction protein
MEREQPNEHEDGQSSPERSGTPEQKADAAPRIYVASLSDYNNGRLHGEWIDADADPDEIHHAIEQMLERSPTEGAEEFAIHDFDGFFPWRPGEFESIGTVSAVAQGIAAHGPAFAHWAEIVNTSDPDLLDRFEDAFLGLWASVEEYATDLADNVGLWTEGVAPDSLSPYFRFDYEAFARDLELSGDITTSEGDGGVYIFEGNL